MTNQIITRAQDYLGIPQAYGRFDKIDLERLAMPDAIESLSFEAIRTEMIAALGEPYNRLPLSDPMIKLIEVAAAREIMLRARVNDSVKACMLASARGHDLENLAALYGVSRRLIREENSDASPPIEAVWEDDDSLRARTQLAPEGFSVAGPQGAYIFHGLSAAPELKDLSAVGPEAHKEPGVVKIYALARQPGERVGQDILEKVYQALNADGVRPLADKLEVYPANLVSYQIKAELVTYPGPDPEVVLALADKAIKELVDRLYRLGHDIRLSAITAALHQSGCQRVEITEPAQDLVLGYDQAGWCQDLVLSYRGVDV